MQGYRLNGKTPFGAHLAPPPFLKEGVKMESTHFADFEQPWFLHSFRNMITSASTFSSLA